MDDLQHLKEEAWLLREKHGGAKSFEFETDRERLRRGEPLAYIIGWVPFLSTKIWLDSYPLIPRPETEFWVEKAIENIKAFVQVKSEVRMLDLCAGSGCIGVALLKAVPEARVDFAEIDPRHHTTIQKNIEENGIDTSHTRIFGGDLFTDIPEGTRYDFILTNPPYIDPALDRAEESVKVSEPHQALYGGRGGMEVIARIIAAASTYLTESGILYLEHEPEQVNQMTEYAVQYNFHVTTYKDQYGILRYSKLHRKNVRK